MRKSVVTVIVTTIFVVYSFYQRTIGVQATADGGPGPIAGLNPTVTGIASGDSQSQPGAGASQSPSANQAPAAPTSSPVQAQSRQSRGPAGRAATGSAPTPVPQPAQTPAQNSGSPYKDGTYTGVPADAFYGNIQVQATVSNGKLTNIRFLQWPNDRSRSIRINQQALPWLTQEAVQAQSANVDMISGATDTSDAFSKSLQSAVSEARA